MAFTPKAWEDWPSTDTPTDAAALIDLEERVTDYTDSALAAWPHLASYVTRVGPFPADHDRLISAFQSGHGWTASGTGSQTDDTSNFTAGSRSLQITPATDTTEQVATKTLTPGIDLSGSYLRLQMLLGGVIGTLKIRVASGVIGTDYAEATIWSSSNRAWLATGQWEHVWVPRGEFVTTGYVDWSAITTIQLRAAATGAGTVNCKINRLSYVPDANSGCVVFAFDDGLASVYSRARPKLAEYGWPGSAFIIADMIDTGTGVDARGAMTTTQLQELQNRYGWEIGSHAYYLANHNTSGGFPNVSAGNTATDFYLMRKWLDDRGLTGGESFAWPQGAYGTGQTTLDIARKFFATARSTKGNAGSRSHELAHHPLDRHRIKGWSINGLTHTTGDVSTAITEAKNRGEVLILVFHDITAGAAASATDWSIANFNTVVDAVAASGINVRTYGQAMAGL